MSQQRILSRSAVVKAFGIPSVSFNVKPALPVAPLPPTSIEIRVKAASVNALDVAMRNGYGKNLFEAGGLGLPFVTGRDASGIVTRIGNEAPAMYTPPLVSPWSDEPTATTADSEIKVGDEVIVGLDVFDQGSMSDYVHVHPALVARKPSNLTHTQAAALPFVGLTAFEALFDVAKVQNGQKLFIYGGSGGIGSACIQLAKLMDCHVTTTASAEKADAVRNYGADEVVVREEQEAILKESKGKFDVVIDAVKGGVKQSVLLDCVARGGSYVTLNGPLILSTDEFGLVVGGALGFTDLLEHKARAHYHRGINFDWCLYHACGERLALLAQAAESGHISIPVSHEFSLKEIAAAHAAFERGEANPKIVVDMEKE